MKHRLFSCIAFVVLTVITVAVLLALTVALDGWLSVVLPTDHLATAAEGAMQLTATYGAVIYSAQLTAIYATPQASPEP